MDYVADRTGRAGQRKGIFSPEWGSHTVVDADGNVVPNYTMFIAVVAEPAQTAVLRVGLSMEAWETVASQTPDRAGSLSSIDMAVNGQWCLTKRNLGGQVMERRSHSTQRSRGTMPTTD